MAKTTKKAGTKTQGPVKKASAKKSGGAATSPAKKATAKKAAPKKAAAKKATAKKAAARPAAAGKAATRQITAADRRQMIAEAAYLRGESQGFTSDEHDDWLQAEAEVDALLARSKVEVRD